MIEAGGTGESVFTEQGSKRFAGYLKAEGYGEDGRRLVPRPQRGTNLVGYLTDPRGVGEAARQMAAALEVGDVPLATVDAPTEERKVPGALGRLGYDDYPYDFNLICVNADMLPIVAKGLGPRFFEKRRTAGLWFWEISHFPAEQRHAFDHVDEVWVATQHVADALRPLSSKPVRTVRMPIVPGEPGSGEQGGAGDAGGLLLPLRLRLPEHLQAQEPARPGRGVLAGPSRPARGPRW